MFLIVAGDTENEYFITKDLDPIGFPEIIYSYTSAFSTEDSLSFKGLFCVNFFSMLLYSLSGKCLLALVHIEC